MIEDESWPRSFSALPSPRVRSAPLSVPPAAVRLSGPSRTRSSRSRRLVDAVSSERGRLVTLLVAALVVRLPLVVLTPGYDVRDYKVWARTVGETGIGGAYAAEMPPGIPWINYPPVHLHVLRATAWLYAALRPDGAWDDQLLAALLKLTPVAAELALGLLLYRYVRRHISAALALPAAAALLFNPALIWNTAYWGGIDAFHSLLLAAALFAAATGRPRGSAAFSTAAVAAKLLALPGALAAVPAALRDAGPRQVAWLAAIVSATALLIAAPILVRGEGATMLRAMQSNLGNQPYASANAHNLWWLVTRGDGWRFDTLQIIPGVEYRRAGLALFVGIATWAMLLRWRRDADGPDDLIGIPATGALLSYAFFILTTEVHENWSMAMFAPLAAAAAGRPRYRPLYVALTLTTLANLALHDPPLRVTLGPGVDDAARLLGVLNAAAGCAALLWWTVLLASERRRSPDELTPRASAATATSRRKG